MTVRSHPKEGGFTLVEALVVMAILGILLVAGLVTFRGTGDKARRAATDELVGLVEQARTKAITSRSFVAVAFAPPGSIPQHTGTTSMSLVQLPDDWSPDSNDSADTTLLTRWSPLETGIILLGGTTSAELVNPLNVGTVDIRYTTRQSVEAAVHLLAFNPRGRLVYPVSSASAELRLAEGTYVRGNPIPYKRGADDSISQTRLKVGRVVGRCYEIAP